MNLVWRRVVRGGRILVALTALWLIAVPAQAAIVGTVDFDSLSVGPIPGGSITFSNVGAVGVNVTFSGTGLSIRDLAADSNGGGFFNFPAGHLVLTTTSDNFPITVVFSANFSATQVSVTNLLSAAETYCGTSCAVDFIKGTAFSTIDGSGPAVDSDISAAATFTLTGPGIKSVLYEAAGPGYTLDDFTFVGAFDEVPPPPGVPGPAPLLLVCLGLLGLGAVAHRPRGRQD